MNSGLDCVTDQIKVIHNSDGYFSDEPEHLESTTCRNAWLSTWKFIKTSVADTVLQVPLSLRVRVSSLCGTVRLHVKPPPSDQLWFGFASMSEIEWNFESTIGGQRINNGDMTSLLKKLLDHSLRESLVFPNHEWVCMPWMIDQENWIPVSKAPFGWINQESSAGFTDCSKSTPGRSTESSFEDVREFDHELLMDELEVNVLESNVSEEVAPSKNSSSTGNIENYEMVAAKAKDWDPSTKTKKFRTVKKMVGASLKKYEKMKVNIIGEETPNLRSSEK